MYNIEIHENGEIIQTKVETLEELEEVLKDYPKYDSVYAQQDGSDNNG